MYIKQLYTDCLAEAAYYIESNGEAAIIDPLRETEPYIQLANERGAKIKYVFETHFHADFVSGHVDLARKTGASIVYGPTAQAQYQITVAEDSQEFPLGDVVIKVLHTPGHTMESSCFLLVDEHGDEHSVFTGDTLFIGDVGRPDLAVKTDLSREDLARYLYKSINEKLLTLRDDVVVYPGHGAGSQCGKSLSEDRQSTIGEEKKFNYALQVRSEEEFVQKVTEGLNTPPQYFPKNAVINKTGYESIDEVMQRGMQALGPNEFEEAIQSGGVVLDSRNSIDFMSQHIPGALHIGLDGFFAVWVGTLVEDLNTPLLIVAEANDVETTILRLARVGYENVQGYLTGGMQTWSDSGKNMEQTGHITVEEFQQIYPECDVLDVRNVGEFDDAHVEGAMNIPLEELSSRFGELNPDTKYYLCCKTGYRSAIACSILRRHGINRVANIDGGFDGIQAFDPSCHCIAQ